MAASTQTPCIGRLFNNIDQVGVSTQNNVISQIHLVVASADLGRPFIPICGMTQGVDGNYIPDTMANNQTHKKTFLDFGLACYNASVNYVADPLVGQDRYTPTDGGLDFGQYLYKRLAADPSLLARYMSSFSKVWDFWTMINLANTQQEYYNQLTALFQKIVNECDKQLYIPPGLYTFDAPSPFQVSWDAWKTAVPGLVALMGVELSIG